MPPWHRAQWEGRRAEFIGDSSLYSEALTVGRERAWCPTFSGGHCALGVFFHHAVEGTPPRFPTPGLPPPEDGVPVALRPPAPSPSQGVVAAVVEGGGEARRGREGEREVGMLTSFLATAAPTPSQGSSTFRSGESAIAARSPTPSQGTMLAAVVEGGGEAQREREGEREVGMLTSFPATEGDAGTEGLAVTEGEAVTEGVMWPIMRPFHVI